MKVNYRFYFWLVVLSVAVTCVFLALMPDTVPMHYNTAGAADRFGSKYENLVFPLCVAGTALIFAALAKNVRTKPLNEPLFFYIGLITLIFFNVMFTYFLWTALTYDDAAPIHADINRFSTIAIGVTLVVLGNIMPKARRNSLFGLRTPWSMSSDAVWQKSQRFGGISSVAVGLLMCLLAAALEGTAALLTSTGLILVWVVLCMMVSWHYYRQEQKE